jgi:hypothetical protein
VRVTPLENAVWLALRRRSDEPLLVYFQYRTTVTYVRVHENQQDRHFGVASSLDANLFIRRDGFDLISLMFGATDFMKLANSLRILVAVVHWYFGAVENLSGTPVFKKLCGRQLRAVFPSS